MKYHRSSQLITEPQVFSTMFCQTADCQTSAFENGWTTQPTTIGQNLKKHNLNNNIKQGLKNNNTLLDGCVITNKRYKKIDNDNKIMVTTGYCNDIHKNNNKGGRGPGYW